MKNLIYFFYCFIAMVLVSIGGCVSQSYKTYLDQYTGLSEIDLHSQWGVPDKEYTEAGVRYLVYNKVEQRNVMVQPAIYQPYFDGKNVHHRIVQPERWALRDVRCTTTFSVEGGVVISSRYDGGCIAP